MTAVKSKKLQFLIKEITFSSSLVLLACYLNTKYHLLYLSTSPTSRSLVFVVVALVIVVAVVIVVVVVVVVVVVIAVVVVVVQGLVYWSPISKPSEGSSKSF